MGQVCRGCGGKGWRWTGAERVACGRCGGSGSRELPPEQRRDFTTVQVPDPIRTRRR